MRNRKLRKGAERGSREREKRERDNMELRIQFEKEEEEENHLPLLVVLLPQCTAVLL